MVSQISAPKSHDKIENSYQNRQQIAQNRLKNIFFGQNFDFEKGSSDEESQSESEEETSSARTYLREMSSPSRRSAGSRTPRRASRSRSRSASRAKKGKKRKNEDQQVDENLKFLSK